MMIRVREGMVVKVLMERERLQEIQVAVEDSLNLALVYTAMTGCVKEGDRVLLNTTAGRLGLGTGGYGFVIANLENSALDMSGQGHIMKLRYTPMQVKCFAAEEQQSRFHDKFNSFTSLKGSPVVVAPLHSVLGPLCALVKKKQPGTKIGYVMTDGAALPIALSKTIPELKEKGLLDVTVTSGNAFGGDFETVNFYTGIIAAKQVAGCDLVVTGMGPGITGTATKYGFTGVEQGYIIDGITTLGGLPVALPRISFADKRIRHRGISHHSITVLADIAKTRAILPLPELEQGKLGYIKGQILKYNIDKKHSVVFNKGEAVLSAMEDYCLKTTTMGRGIEEDRDYFLGIGACAETLAGYLQ